jgi:hypothetical protein
MALTAAQILDIRADLGIGASGAADEVFTDAELNQLFDRAGDDYNLAVYYGWRQILSNAAAWVDYKVAQTSVSRSQAFQHIKDMVVFWGNESRSTANQVRIVGAVPVPTVYKPEPADARVYPDRYGRYPWHRWR